MASPRPSLLRRPALWLGVLGVGAVIGVGVGVAIGWRAAMERSFLSTRCRVLERVDLEVDEIVALKDRWKAYVRSEHDDAALELTPREATFLLRGESKVGVWLDGHDETLDVLMTVPSGKGCYNVEFTGQVTVAKGLAVMDVERLEVGGRDLSDLAGLGGALGGSKQAVSPEDIEDPDVAAALSNIDSLQVHQGRLHIRFIDPSQVWR